MCLPQGVARTDRWDGRGPVAVWCHGVPGPLVLYSGDQATLAQVDPERDAYDRTHPWWPPGAGASFFRGAEPLEVESWLRTPSAGARQPITWPDPSNPARASRRAAAVVLTAHALREGDYLEIMAARFPEGDRTADEGFARVQWVGVLDRQHVPSLIADRAWAATSLMVVRTRGMVGLLLLRADQPVNVLGYVNPERAAIEGSVDVEGNEPPWDPLIEPTTQPADAPGEAAGARAVLNSWKPPCGEAELYPRRFTDPEERRLLLEGINGLRLVPLSSLPWPHHLSRCPHLPRVKALLETYPDGRRYDAPGPAAHAEVFARLTGQDFAECRYHQANWALIGEIAAAAVRDHAGDWRAALAGTAVALSPEEQGYLEYLFADPIKWDDGDGTFTNGQHRSCALRAAGVAMCPVRGRYLAAEPYPATVPAREHAERTVASFWISYVRAHVGERRLTHSIARALSRWPALRRFLPTRRHPG